MAKKKNNKISGSTWVIIVCAAILICSITITEIMAGNSNKLTDISVATYQSLIASDTEKLVLLYKNDSSESKKMMSSLETIKADTIPVVEVYAINVDNLSATELATITSSTTGLGKTYPTVIQIGGGAVIGSYSEKTDVTSISNWMERFTKISVSEYVTLSGKDEESYIYIGRPTCPHCVASMPLLKRIIATLGKPIYYINIDNETSTDLSTLTTVTTNIYNGSTPLFMVVKNGVIIRHQAGEDTYTNLTAFYNGTK